MVPAPDNDPLKPSSYRIPYMERLGQNKILKGTISVTFLYLFYSPTVIQSDMIFILKTGLIMRAIRLSTSEIMLSVNEFIRKLIFQTFTPIRRISST